MNKKDERMTLFKAVLIIEYHNEWRRDPSTTPQTRMKQVKPKELGEALDLVVKYIKESEGMND